MSQMFLVYIFFTMTLFRNPLFPTFQLHKFQKISKYNLSNKAAFLYDQKVKTNILVSQGLTS